MRQEHACCDAARIGCSALNYYLSCMEVVEMQSHALSAPLSARLLQPVLAIRNFLIRLSDALEEAQRMRDAALRRYPHLSFDA